MLKIDPDATTADGTDLMLPMTGLLIGMLGIAAVVTRNKKKLI